MQLVLCQVKTGKTNDNTTTDNSTKMHVQKCRFLLILKQLHFKGLANFNKPHTATDSSL